MSRQHDLPPVTESLREVWCAFADHFLDTETRHELPRAALVAVEAGLSLEQAEAVWKLDVLPVVGPNLLSVAGEWACWDRDWLCGRIEEARALRAGQPGWLRAAVDTLNSLEIDLGATRRALLACMAALAPLALEPRRALAADLGLLGGHFFDFVPGPIPDEPARRRELRQLLDAVFLPAMRPLVHASVEERAAVREARVRAALQ